MSVTTNDAEQHADGAGTRRWTQKDNLEEMENVKRQMVG